MGDRKKELKVVLVPVISADENVVLELFSGLEFEDCLVVLPSLGVLGHDSRVRGVVAANELVLRARLLPVAS